MRNTPSRSSPDPGIERDPQASAARVRVERMPCPSLLIQSSSYPAFFKFHTRYHVPGTVLYTGTLMHCSTTYLILPGEPAGFGAPNVLLRSQYWYTWYPRASQALGFLGGPLLSTEKHVDFESSSYLTSDLPHSPSRVVVHPVDIAEHSPRFISSYIFAVSTSLLCRRKNASATPCRLPTSACTRPRGDDLSHHYLWHPFLGS